MLVGEGFFLGRERKGSLRAHQKLRATSFGSKEGAKAFLHTVCFQGFLKKGFNKTVG